MPSRARSGDPVAFADVLARAVAGDGAAWASLYRELAPALVGYLRAQGSHDAEDLTSEVFLTLVRRIASFHGDAAQFRSFAFVIAHRRLQDERRRERRRPATAPLPDRPPRATGASPDAAEEADLALARERVLARCATLTEEQRDVVLLRVVADLSLEEVAAAIGRTRGAVKALQHRAFEHIRREISREAVSP